MTILSVDIETYSSVDLKSSGVYAYTEAPDFEILLFGYAFDDDSVQVIDLASGKALPAQVLQALTDPNIIKTAFNAAFERTCIAKHFKLPMPPEAWRCTQVHALTLGLPIHLEGVAQAMRLNVQKDTAGKNLIRYFSMPCKPTKTNGQRTRNLPEHAPEKWEQFIEYCRVDVKVEREIRRRLAQYPVLPIEQRLWCLDQKINDTGVRVNPVLVANAIECDNQYQQRLTEEAAKLTGLDNPNSVSQLKAWLQEAEGLEVDSLNKATVPELIKQAESDVTKRVLELRQEMAKTSIKKYMAMDRTRCRDDRARGLLQFYGANRTGRWCLAEGTPILVRTEKGDVLEKPIELVTTEDQVWDGEQWVNHDGVVFSGDKDVITWDGITATAEHVVYISDTENLPLGTAKERGLPLWRGHIPYTD